MITDWDQKSWNQRIAELKANPVGDAFEVSAHELDLACCAIAGCPYDTISDSILRLNGGCLESERYDIILRVLIADEVLFPVSYGRFQINRKKIPQNR